MRTLALMAGLVTLAAASGAVAHPHDVEVDWAELPSAAVMQRHYPRAAMKARVSGWVVILCRLKADGRAKNCRAAAEGPRGYGFGEATVAASKSFRMTMKTADGRSAEGEVVRIPLRWGDSEIDLPPEDYLPGQPALMTSIAPQNALRFRTAPCPPPDSERRCPTFNWARRPEAGDIKDLVRQAGDTPSLMRCTIAETGLLHSCQATAPPELIPELLKLAETFEAPPLTPDRTPTMDKQVALTFDWRALRRYLDTYEAVLSSR